MIWYQIRTKRCCIALTLLQHLCGDEGEEVNIMCIILALLLTRTIENEGGKNCCGDSN